MDKKSFKRLLRKNIRRYIDKNCYLLKTDDIRTINCELKPRLVSQAVSNSCKLCQEKKHDDEIENDCYVKLFNYGIKYAAIYISKPELKNKKIIIN